METRTSHLQLDNIDLLKFLLSIVVVAYHTQVFADIDTTAYKVLRLVTNAGVGSFFVISGYLLSMKLKLHETKEERLTALAKTIKRLLILWLVWEVIYTPFVLYSVRTGTPAEQALLSNYIYGSIGHLWYLRASVFAVIMLWAFTKAGIDWKLSAAAALLLHLTGAYMISVAHNFSFRNGLFFAFPYYCCGMITAILQHRLSALFKWKRILIAAGLILAYIIESILLETGQSTFIMPFICSLGLLSFLKVDISIPCSGILRRLSTLLYTIHFGVFSIISHLVRSGRLTANSPGIFILTLTISLIIAFIILMLQKKIRVLKILY